VSLLNLGTAKEKAIQLINEYSNNGNLISDATNADYKLRMNNLADMAQKEIAQFLKIHAVYQISQNPIKSQFGLLQGFDIVQHLDTDLIYEAVGSQAYYFEVDNVADIYIEENVSGVWTNLVTINNTTKKQFTAYKGLLTPFSTSNTVRMRFSGSYPYNLRNRALYAYSFPVASDVPDYKPYVKYDMPADFMELNKVVHITDPRVYKQMVDFYWEGKKTFVANYYHTGSFDIHYYKYPTDITSATLDSYTFEIDTEAQELIPYYIGGHIVLDENPAVAATLLNLYQQKLANLDANVNIGVTNITDVYGW
jgi:hypothetical protein